MADLEVLPQTLNLSFWRGDDISVPLTFATSVDENNDPVGPIDVSSWTFSAQVRTSYSSSAVQATFDIDTTDAVSGEIVLSIAAADVAALSGKKYVWDLQSMVGGTTVTRVAGTFNLDGDVTRSA